MIGGVEDRESIYFDTADQTWKNLVKLPEKHNLSCVVTLNYKDEAVFTFMVDGKFNFRSYVMPLKESGLQLEAQ